MATDINQIKGIGSKLEDFNKKFSTISNFNKLLTLGLYVCKFVLIYGNKGRISTRTEKSVKNLLSSITDTQSIFRLIGAIPLLSSLIKKQDKSLSLNKKVQTLSMLLFFPLDNLSWLSGKGVGPIDEQDIAPTSRLACKFWFIYTLLEFINLWKDYQQNEKDLNKAYKSLYFKDIKTEEINEKEKIYKELKDERYKILKSTILNLGTLPLSLHFSLENSFFNPVYLDAIGLVSSIAQLFN